ncbi:MAG: hypothetical protein NT141_02115 [candidate division WWE3 bacterium]|nr:hypothetical protein [candidate division WWE3 bacterium]
MDLGSVYKRAWQAVKNNKVLWVIGVLVMAVTGGTGFSGGNFSNFGKSQTGSSSASASLKNVESTFSSLSNIILGLLKQIPMTTWVFVAVAVVIAIVVGIAVALLIRSFAVGALIGGTYEALNGTKVGFPEISHWGKKSWKSLAALSFLPKLLLLFALGAIGGIGAILIVSRQATFLGFLVLISGILAVVIGGFFTGVASLWGERLIVIHNLGWWAAFKEGFKMFWKNLSSTLLIGLVNTLLGCGLGCVLVPISTVVILILIVFSLIPVVGWLLIPVFVILGLALLTIVTLGLGIFTAFKYATWSTLFKDLKEPKEVK